MGVAVRTCYFAFAALVVTLFSMLSGSSQPASAAAVGPSSVSIVSPIDGAVFPVNTVITFTATGADWDGTPLVRGQLFWSSSQNGFLGTGQSFTRDSSTLALGSHTIQLIATGSNFQVFTNVTLWIGPPPTATPTNTPTLTPTNIPTSTATSTATSTPTPTNTPTDTPTPTPTDTPTDTPTSTPTNTPTFTATNTPAPARDPSPTARPGHPRNCADFDGNGRVDWRDLWLIARAIQHHSHDLKFDVNGNGRVGWADFRATVHQLGHRCGNGPQAAQTPSPHRGSPDGPQHE